MRNNSSTGAGDTEKTLLRRLQVLGFALYDTVLYLDTHPEDSGALEYYDKIKEAYNTVKVQYERSCGPLTNMDEDSEKGWTWTARPWPWEYDAN